MIDSLHQPTDMALERVTPFIGLPMGPLADASSRSRALFAFGELTNEWSYTLIWSLDADTHLPGYGLRFYPSHRGIPPQPMTDICRLDVAQFHDALLKMGYRHAGSSRRATLARQYLRGLVEVEIGIVGESGESLEKISHDCVKTIGIDFLQESQLHP